MSILPLALQPPKLSDEVLALDQTQLASASKFEGSLPMSIREAFAWNYPIHRDRNCSSYTHTLYVVSTRPLLGNPTFGIRTVHLDVVFEIMSSHPRILLNTVRSLVSDLFVELQAGRYFGHRGVRRETNCQTGCILDCTTTALSLMWQERMRSVS